MELFIYKKEEKSHCVNETTDSSAFLLMYAIVLLSSLD